MKRRYAAITLVAIFLIFSGLTFLFGLYPRPYRETVEFSGISPSLVYAVIKTESSFNEKAVSRAGAVGLMQIKPSTAQFICEKKGISYDEQKLSEGEYNVRLGCAYLLYLLDKFPVAQTALAAYNAGEGTVSLWLKDKQYSENGQSLCSIPYPETAAYVKKISKFQKIYEILY